MKRLITIVAAGIVVLCFGASGAAASPDTSEGATIQGIAQSLPQVTFARGWLEWEVLAATTFEPKRRWKKKKKCYKRCKKRCKRAYKRCRRRRYSKRKCKRKKRKCKKRCRRRCRYYR